LSDTIKKLNEAIILGKDQDAIQLAKQALSEGVSAYDVAIQGLAAPMKIVGDKYETHEYFLPQVLFSAKALYAALDVVKPELEKFVASGKVESPGTYITGVVQGDTHDIGKNLVKIMVEASGFKVIDLGRDVPLTKFVDEVKKNAPCIIGSSTLMTTTMPMMDKLEELLREAGVRDNCKTLIGGSPCSQAFADRIGADAFGEDAADALRKIKELATKLK
jgi:corrinoid protein of di/trimethylamine methyltransferase